SAVVASLSIVVSLAVGADPVVPAARKEIQPLIEKHLPEAQSKTLKELALANRIPALAKTPVRGKGVADPCAAMTELEKSRLNSGDQGKGGVAELPGLLDALGTSLGKPAASDVDVPRGKLASQDDHVRYITAIFDKAREMRDAAFAKVAAKDRQRLF